MSVNPTDPFDQRNPNPPTTPTSYAQDDFNQQPPRRSGNRLLIGCLIAGVVGALVCCGGMFAMYRFGTTMMGEVIRDEIRDSPTIVEHIGDIESLQMNIGATSEEVQNAPAGQGSPLVFDIVGSKGSGQVVVMQSGAAGTIVDSAILVLPDGERLPIELAGNAEELDDIEQELNNLEFDVPVEADPAP